MGHVRKFVRCCCDLRRDDEKRSFSLVSFSNSGRAPIIKPFSGGSIYSGIWELRDSRSGGLISSHNFKPRVETFKAPAAPSHLSITTSLQPPPLPLSLTRKLVPNFHPHTSRTTIPTYPQFQFSSSLQITRLQTLPSLHLHPFHYIRTYSPNFGI